MLDGKKTKIASVVAVLSGILAMLGAQEVISTSELTELITAIVTVVSGLGALYGRWDAQRRHNLEIQELEGTDK